jgi:hypothetical protein
VVASACAGALLAQRGAHARVDSGAASASSAALRRCSMKAPTVIARTTAPIRVEGHVIPVGARLVVSPSLRWFSFNGASVRVTPGTLELAGGLRLAGEEDGYTDARAEEYQEAKP